MKRIKSLDILRGLTVILMIIVNNPGNWDNTFSCLKHAQWDGFTITDFVFPSFLFIVGASVWMAFRKYNHKLDKEASIKILKRGALIYLVGVLLNWFPFYDFSEGRFIEFDNVRLIGVLPRIGLVYIIGSFIVLSLRTYKRILLAMLSLMSLYTIIVYSLGNDTLNGYIGTNLDIAVFGDSHIYHGYGVTFEPEGLLGTMTSICTMMLGYMSAMLIGKSDNLELHIKELVSLGGIVLLLGITLDYFIPINKSIWSASYVLYAGGISMILWGIFAYWYDVRKKGSLEPIALTFGTNALFTYILADIVAISAGFPIFLINGTSLFGYVFEKSNLLFSPNISSLIGALLLVGICWVITYPLYQKKIYIKL